MLIDPEIVKLFWLIIAFWIFLYIWIRTLD